MSPKADHLLQINSLGYFLTLLALERKEEIKCQDYPPFPPLPEYSWTL